MAAATCLLVLVAAWQAVLMEAHRPAALSGPAVSVGSGPRVPSELAGLAVAWYLDWGFDSRHVPGYQRLDMVLARGQVSTDAVARAARRRPGSWWSLGNEPNDPYQDNQTPAQHARFFRDMAEAIRRADPSARILSAGIADADWLWAQEFREEYRKLTGRLPALDGWNIHNYILGDDQDPYDIGEFKRRIAAFRSWMDAIGDGDKPLILSEFGVLYGAGCCERPIDAPERGVAYMVETVTWLARGDLVQGWAWFMTNSGEMQFNGDLFDAEGRPTPFGLAYRELNKVYWLEHRR